MDTFVEQIVSKSSSGKDTLIKVGLVLAALVVSFLCLTLPVALGLVMLSSVGFILAAGSVYGAWYLISAMSVEYEYIITNGEIDVDKIIARRRRKRLITVKVQNFEAFGRIKDAPDPAAGTTTILASAGGDGNLDFYADFNHAKHGQVRLVFSPNQKSLDSLRPFLPRMLKMPV